MPTDFGTRLSSQVFLPSAALDVTGFSELNSTITSTTILSNAIHVSENAWLRTGERDGWQFLSTATVHGTNPEAKNVHRMAESVLMLLDFADRIQTKALAAVQAT